MPTNARVNIVIGAKVNGALSGIQRLTGGVNRLVGTLTAGLTVGAFARFTKQAIDNADAMGKMASRLGVTVESMSKLAFAAKLSAVSQEQLQTAVTQLSAKILDNHKAFSLLGISVRNSDGSMRDSEKVLFDIAEIFSRMPDGVEKTAIATKLFGESGARLIPMLNSLKELSEQAEKAGAVVDSKTSTAAAKFNDNLTIMKTRLNAVFLGIANEILPALNSYARAMVQAGDAGRFGASVGKVIRAVLQNLAGAFVILESSASFAWRSVSRGFEALEKFSTGFAARRLARAGAKSVVELIFGKSNTPDDQRAADAMTDNLKAALETAWDEGSDSLIKQAEDAKSSLGKVFGKLGAIPLIDAAPKIRDIFVNTIEDMAAAINDKLEPQVESVGKKIERLPSAFRMRMLENLQIMAEEFSAFGRNVADVLASSVGRSIDAVADGMWAVIDGTATWGQIFAQVARSIISDTVRIVLQWIVSQTIIRGLQRAFGLERSAQAQKEAVESMPGATAASISSYGAAAAIGIAALLAALAIGMSAFAEGGVTPGRPTLAMVGERGREFVVSNRGVNAVGLPFLQALNEGRLGGGVAGGGAAPNVSVNSDPRFNFAVMSTRTELQEFLESSPGRTFLVDAIKRSKAEIGIRT